ncbi:BadF/BadG/BcrA/BcrD ATPase family protein [Bacillus sp. FJAT-45350]|uniref:BadF/BadG/BcrA/BcrD ATPase family protein n=1 Tax=Bacillus sp. FJAT-45350 TaxID=2011014 RepID=UPI000BB9880E|nr:BadF/BadG/BcrA/BcrD ATPase family protein [Bacillus sp. FJAT-45350]
MTGGNQSSNSLIIGIDVGSTTVKATVVNPYTKEILWSDYKRHHTKQAEKVLEFLVTIGNQFSHVATQDIRVFITGSGGGSIAEYIGAKFVQEVNAVTMAVEELHPDVGSVVELGGQDAKIIIFKENEETGDKQAITSMNDKCASGTGATIDKCMIKVGLPEAEVAKLQFDDSKLHHVAAKCGVFAETDIVNLVKSSIPSTEIMCSLADAIVMQNLSVLTRGNTLKHKVLLLGGPNTYLPFLQQCWRKRIPEAWKQRGYKYPTELPIEELIFIPENSQYYAAYGAVMYGIHEPADVGIYKGIEQLKTFITHGRKAKLGEKAGDPLVQTEDELHHFREKYSIPKFSPPTFKKGQTVRAVIGVDGGSTSSKAVLVGTDGEILLKEYQLSKGNPIQDTKELLTKIRDKVYSQGASLEILGFGATGYAADVLEKTLHADVNIVETVAHMNSAVHYFDDIDVICDIGGQDIKVLFLKNGDIRNFRLSNQCSAGNGMLLQAIADQFGVPIQEYADTAFRAELSPKFSYGCAVFLDSDRVNFQKEGYSKEELLAGLALVLPKNVWQYVVQIPRMAELGRKFVLQGGTQHNLAAVKAQVDYIEERVPDAEVYVHPHSGEAGAIGAAMETLRVVNRRGYTTFLGLDAAIGISYSSRNDESTRCGFCPNLCSRTFIDTVTPNGQTARYISGFSCEKGTVEDKKAVVQLTRERNQLKKEYPNIVDYEARRLFQHFYEPDTLPKEGTMIEDVKQKPVLLGLRKKQVSYMRQFNRSSIEAQEWRNQIRIGIPKVLNMWSTAPFWRTYFEALGVNEKNITFSHDTTEEMLQQGGKYGSIDPCYPSKVAQAHVHHLLYKRHREDNPLHGIVFPCITHIPTYLQNVMDSTCCPIVAGAPNVIKAAFTKETDFFKEKGVKYFDPAVTFTEPNMLKKQLFEAFEEFLQVTEDESDFAVEEAWKALKLFDAEMQEKGKAILEQLEKDNKLGILLIGRPYHLDPGLNHGVLDEFQVLGYPILSMRSIPKDEEWLKRFFLEDLDSGRVEHSLEVTDVWPENFSSNSAQKVWAAKFAARHPNVALLDLSSFKCGHDAPTYGLIDSIVSTAGKAYSALHDIDANKPTGSIKIRVKTYAHSLELHQERLEDIASKKRKLELLIEEKRNELRNSN